MEVSTLTTLSALKCGKHFIKMYPIGPKIHL